MPVRDRFQTAVFAGLLCLATLALLEFGAMATFGVLSDRWPSKDEVAASLDASLPSSPAAAQTAPGSREADKPRTARNILHPYLGFVRNAKAERVRVNRLRVDETINELGFFGASPLAPKPADVVRVAVTGGSVAEELYLYGRDTLAERLAESSVFGERKVEIVSLAVAGFKQPQQLMALSYLMVLGADFDIVINVDGFNEVVLPYTDNVPFEISPSYPFRWSSVAASGIDPEAARLVARVSDAELRLDAWRRRLGDSLLRHSSFALAVWQVYRQRVEAERGDAEAALRERLGSSDLTRGPQVDYESPTQLFRDTVGMWKRASLQLWSLCEDRGIAYFHFLQPNQYVAGSKTFTAAERKAAMLPSDQATRLGAEAGYPMLIAAGARMKKAGLPFFDLTRIFVSETEPIYRDRCCHYFARGYEVLARRIAETIAGSGAVGRSATSSPD